MSDSLPEPVVLIADDDDDVREALGFLVSLEGWRVVEARDGAQAYAIARASMLDVIVMDHRMPGLSGAEVIDRLRADGVRTPIVFVTAAFDFDDLVRGLGLRCALRKPFEPEELLDLLATARAGGC